MTPAGVAGGRAAGTATTAPLAGYAVQHLDRRQDVAVRVRSILIGTFSRMLEMHTFPAYTTQQPDQRQNTTVRTRRVLTDEFFGMLRIARKFRNALHGLFSTLNPSHRNAEKSKCTAYFGVRNAKKSVKNPPPPPFSRVTRYGI